MDVPGNLTIEGPTSVSEYFSAYLDKHVYLISDIHEKKSRCPDPNARPVPLADFLAWTFDSNQNKVIDFFIEKRYVPKRAFLKRNLERMSESYLTDVRNKFAECLINQRDSFVLRCQFRNVRFQLADPRLVSDVSYAMNRLQSRIIVILERHAIIGDKEIASIRKNGRILLETMQGRDVGSIFREHKIIRQFKRIADENLRTIISDFWFSRAMALYEDISIFAQQTQHLSLAELEWNWRSVITWATSLLANIQKFLVLLMDAYTTGRMFREFKQRDVEYHASPRFIIIYAGEGHIINYAKLFTELGLTVVGQDKSDEPGINYQCVKLSMALPFFHHRPISDR